MLWQEPESKKKGKKGKTAPDAVVDDSKLSTGGSSGVQSVKGVSPASTINGADHATTNGKHEVVVALKGMQDGDKEDIASTSAATESDELEEAVKAVRSFSGLMLLPHSTQNATTAQAA